MTRGSAEPMRLEAMAARTLALAHTKPGAHVPPQISMILTEETWVAARAERDRRRRRAVSATQYDDNTPGFSSDVAGYAPATLEDGTPVPATVLAAAMCDCEITRIVIDADGVPLDLGRAERVFTGQQRRAVIARDRECAWPECHAHARWCEVHHMRWWERDEGRTSVDNGVLLCSFHHHEVHRRDLAITRTPERRGGEPPGQQPRAFGIARVVYSFRDRSGRVVAEAGTPRRTGTDTPCTRASATAGGASPAEPLPTWSTDPVTGKRVRDFFLDM